jgi:hypothetical protein
MKRLTNIEAWKIFRDWAKQHPTKDELAELTTCSCGWNGKGSGVKGRFIKGDRCPNCGASLI